MKRFLAIFLVAVPLFAQQPPQQKVSEQIVVTPSQVPETVESTPASVSVVTKDDIDRRAARDVIDVLREVPGINVSRTGSAGKAASIFMRGASSKQTLVLWNGVEINDAYFSGYNFGQFTTAGVDRIEVVRGPFSSLYGADAVGGVINIISSGKGDRTDIDVAAGGHGLLNGGATLSRTSGPASFHLSLEHRRDDGFAANDDDRESNVLGGVNFAATRALSIGLTGRWADYDLGVPKNTNDFATAYVPTPHHRESGTEWQLAVPVALEVGVVHADVRVSQSHRDDHNEDPDADVFGDTVSTRRNAHVMLRATTAFGTLVGGFDGERAEARNHDSFGLDLDTHHRTSQSFFAEDRYSRGGLELAAGLRHDHYDIFGDETSPRVAAAWSVAGNKFRAAYGQAFRAPQIGELYLPFFGNPDLHAERSRSAEVGYDHFFGADASLSVTAFRATYRDLIIYDLALNRFNNIGLAKSHGVEVAANRRQGPFRAALSYTFLRATEEPSGEQLVRRPKHSGSLSLGYDYGATTTQLVVARVGNRPDVNDLFPFTNVVNRAYTVADLAVHWNMGSIAPYAKIENLTNTRYQEVFGYPSPTRRAVIGVRYSMAR